MALAETTTGLMRPWVVAETEPSPYKTAFELGESQMLAFNDGRTSIWLEVFVGNTQYGVGRNKEYTRFSLAQMFVAKRNFWTRMRATGGRIEVHKSGCNGVWKEYDKLEVSPEDVNLSLILLERQIEGALSVLDGSDADSYKARLVLQRALAGETFAKIEKLKFHVHLGSVHGLEVKENEGF